MLVASEDNNCHQATHETVPTLAREDIRKHSNMLAEVSTIGGDTGRHGPGTATAHANPEDDTEDGEVEDSIVGGQ
jgi:hypothetical protein